MQQDLPSTIPGGDQATLVTNWRRRAAAVGWDGRAFIDGQRVNSSARFAVHSPIDNAQLYDAARCGAEEVDRAVAAARRAFDRGPWSLWSPSRRASALDRLAELIALHHEELALVDALEMGKPISSALAEAGHIAPSFCRFFAQGAERLYGEVAGSDSASLAFSIREPHGVVAAISPWNFPTANAVIKVVPALATGNCVVLKPSELTPSSALRLAELAIEAGVPAGVLNVIPGYGAEAGATLIRHPGVDMVTFTGSSATGRRVMALAAEPRARPVVLECGGKSPQIVFEDAPAAAVIAPLIANDVFANQGQVCVARSRLLVHRSRREEFVAELVRTAEGLAIGHPLDPATDFGLLASLGQRDRVLGMVERALDAGARQVNSAPDPVGCLVHPMILENVSPDMAIASEEVFGPVLTVQTFGTVDEALTLANAPSYGLAATAWTSDYRTIHRLIRELKVGEITVRSSAEPVEGPGLSLAAEPRGDSGIGSETGLAGLRACTRLKGVVLTG